MTDERNERPKRSTDSPQASPQAKPGHETPPRWPFPAGSQNDTDKAVKLKPYVPPKRRTLNQY